MGPVMMSPIPSPSMVRRLESYKNDSRSAINQTKYRARVRDFAMNTEAVSVAPSIIHDNAEMIQPGYCVREDCMNCMRLEILIGCAGVCKASCAACILWLTQNSFAEGLEFGAMVCGIDCGFGTAVLSSLNLIKIQCPRDYTFIKARCASLF